MLLLSGIAAFILALLNLQRSYGLARVLRTIEPHLPAAEAKPLFVSLLAPCRGVEAHFEDYVRALLSQSYARYEVLFLVESIADPAWPLLNRLLVNSRMRAPRASSPGKQPGAARRYIIYLFA